MGRVQELPRDERASIDWFTRVPRLSRDVESFICAICAHDQGVQWVYAVGDCEIRKWQHLEVEGERHVLEPEGLDDEFTRQLAIGLPDNASFQPLAMSRRAIGRRLYACEPLNRT